MNAFSPLMVAHRCLMTAASPPEDTPLLLPPARAPNKLGYRFTSAAEALACLHLLLGEPLAWETVQARLISALHKAEPTRLNASLWATFVHPDYWTDKITLLGGVLAVHGRHDAAAPPTWLRFYYEAPPPRLQLVGWSSNFNRALALN